MAYALACSPEVDDARLVESALGGDASAFDQLMRRYERRVVAAAVRLVGDMHDAVEIAQEVFLRAFRRLASLNEPARFGAWLLRITTNLALNYRRSRATTRAMTSLDGGVSATADSSLHDTLPGRDGPLAARLHAAELLERTRDAIERLPARQRTALVLSSIEARPQREIAEQMGCSVEAVKWHVFQARKRLRETLGRQL